MPKKIKKPEKKPKASGLQLGRLLVQADGARQSGQFEAAARFYREILARHKHNPDACFGLALVYRAQGNLQEALKCYDRLIAWVPDHADALGNRGNILTDLGDFDAALQSFDQALALSPRSTALHFNRGAALLRQGNKQGALLAFERVLELEPDHWAAVSNCANLSQELGRFEASLAYWDRVLAETPEDPEACNHKGRVLDALKRSEETVLWFEKALRINPAFAEAQNNLGTALYALNRLDLAFESYNRALALSPDMTMARFNRSMLLLMQGNYLQGWAEYEVRWISPNGPGGFPSVCKPLWRGEVPLAGKSLCIYPEQGLGDVIQFSRYALLAEAEGARVTVLVSASLKRLMSSMPGNIEVLSMDDPWPSFDFYCPLMSLPFAFKTTLETVPGQIPYLFPEAVDCTRWAERMGPKARPRVGLVWAGNPRKDQVGLHALDQARSLSLAMLEPVLAVAGVDFYSLQKDAGDGSIVEQLRRSAWCDRVIDWTDELSDFADTAALIHNLDLVLTVDTSVLHVAGALGKPVWMLDRFNNCWRWMKGRTDSPWYPTLKIFRQHRLGVWDAPITEVANALAEWARVGDFSAPLARLERPYTHRPPVIKGATAEIPTVSPELLHANQLRQSGDLWAAREAYQTLLGVRDDLPDAHFGLGIVCRALGELEEALNHYDRVLSLRPHDADAWGNRGNVLTDLGRLEEAVTSFERALAIAPDNSAVRINQAVALLKAGHAEAALGCYDQVLIRMPQGAGRAEVLCGKGITLGALDRIVEAEQCFELALENAPGHIEAAYQKASAWLKQGRYAEGWRLHKQHPERQAEKARLDRLVGGKPEWNGDFSIAGKTLLVLAEGGHGDVLHFSRYVLLAEAMGAKVLFLVQPSLTRLMRSLSTQVTVLSVDEPPPAFDAYCPAMNLILAFGTTLQTVPGAVPYLSAPTEEVAQWSRRIGYNPRPKVGLVWAGAHSRAPGSYDQIRSLTLSLLEPLLSVPDITFYSLQKDAGEPGGAVSQLRESPWRDTVVDWTDDLKDFADTAALIQNLDLIISVDTSVLHLAGALGKPVWMLDRLNHCWRWLSGRLDSPWYPTLKIFRQARLEYWDEPIEAIAWELARYSGQAHIGETAPPQRQAPPALIPTPLSTPTDLPTRDSHALIAQGNAERMAGHFAEAKLAYLKALDQMPDSVDAHFGLGVVNRALGQAEEARFHYDKVIALSPDYADAYGNRGNVLTDLGELEAAIESFDRAIALNPDSSQIHFNRGVALFKLSRFEAALSAFDQTLMLDPTHFDAENNRANLLGEMMHRLEAAEASYGRALALRPSDLGVRWNRAMLYLLQGRFELGWQEYECGFAANQRQGGLHLQTPHWDGKAALAGKRLFIHPEQGFGDILQFCRYALMAEAMGAKVILGVDLALKRLMETLPGHIEVVVMGQGQMPVFDLHCPVMSLPRAFHTTVETIPAPVPYLFADEAEKARWADRLGPKTKPRIGLVWAGNPRKSQPNAEATDKLRSLRLAQLSELLAVETVTFYSLQKDAGDGDIVAQLRDGPWRDRIVDYTEELTDFADTAALIANLDLVISVDTSIVHLAGALGKPVWMLDRFNNCWRWMLDRQDSPWYPQTLRIFRQPSLGDWEGAIHFATQALRDFANVRPPSPHDLVLANTLLKEGMAAHQKGEHGLAEIRFKAVIEKCPEAFVAYKLLGALYGQEWRFEESKACLLRARRGLPQDGQVLCFLGNTLGSLNCHEEALVVYGQAIELNPDWAENFYNRAGTFRSLGKLEQARKDYEKALSLSPDHLDARWNLAAVNLALGRYAEGWQGYEARRERAEWKREYGHERWSKPAWLGKEDLSGKTICICPEQGSGDTLQFARYIPLIEAMGAKVILGATPELARILGTVSPHVYVSTDYGNIPPFDTYCQIVSLPLALGTRVETIPAKIPYLCADPIDVARWAERLGPSVKPRIGLVWAGNPRKDQPIGVQEADKHRSIPLSLLSPLLSLPDVEFYSLQKDAGGGENVAQLREGVWRERVVDWTDDLHDFADTAALIQNLDLVITVDTSVLHLAGALGKPVWLIDRLDHCWRWLHERSDSPWYPTLRIFRQSRLRDWSGAIDALVEALPVFLKTLQKAPSATPPAISSRLALASLPERLVDAASVMAAGEFDRALSLYQGIAKDFPRAQEAHLNIGVLRRKQGDYEGALFAYDQALAIDTTYVAAYSNRGNVLTDLGRYAEAFESFEKALVLRPDFWDALSNKGVLLHNLSRFDEAMDCYNQVLRTNPEDAYVHLHRAFLNLSQGRYREAWIEHEWRFKAYPHYAQTFSAPVWSGDASLIGKRLLIYREQGLGDVIQFSRYALLAEAAGAHVILGVGAEVSRLLRSLPGNIKIVQHGDALPQFDLCIPVLSLPKAFNTTVETIPAPVPYLSADATLAGSWAERMSHLGRGLRVGLVWAGNREDYPGDRQRSVPLERLSPLFEIPGVLFFSLQKDSSADGSITRELRDSPWSKQMTDWTEELRDFADTAALVQNLDLVITVDTSVVHLAGAMGKPVWMMDRLNHCWRWLHGRTDSPWYPSLRIFRQRSLGVWDHPVLEVAEALREHSARTDQRISGHS